MRSQPLGAAHPDEVRRNVRWAGESLDEELLHEVERVLSPERDVGWTNGRPENQHPGGQQ